MPTTRAQMATGLAAVAILMLCTSAPAASGRTHLFRGLNAGGLKAEDNQYATGNPDLAGAIGRAGYLEFEKDALALFGARTLEPIGTVDPYALWNHNPVGSLLVDPQVVWDDAARRWYAAEITNTTSGNQLLFAWSKTADPLLDDGWCTMAISTGAFDDFPMLGFSSRHILIGTNHANLRTNELLSARIWAIGKPLIGDTSCATLQVTAFGRKRAPLRGMDGQIAETPVAVNPGRSSNSGYVISADCPRNPPAHSHEPSCQSGDPRSNQITVWRVHGSRASPILTRKGAVRVPLYKEPKPVPQPGSRRRLDPSDTRLTQAVSAPDPTRGGRLAIWTQHAVAGPSGRAVIRWYELDPHRLSLLRHGRIASRKNWVFNGAISPNAGGDGAVIDYNVAGPHMLPEIRARSRGPGTAKGRMRGAVTLGRSVAFQKACSISARLCEWGDYSAATPDPVHPNVVWGSNQLLLSRKHRDAFGSNWGTRNFAVRTDR